MHIGFDEQPRWTVEWITSARFFVPALLRIMPTGAVLYLESYAPREEFIPFIQQHRCDPAKREDVYEASPPCWTEHLQFDNSLVHAFERFFHRWNSPYADHVHGYHQGELIFWFHDAFSGGDMHVSGKIDAERVQLFCADLAPKARFELNAEQV